MNKDEVLKLFKGDPEGVKKWNQWQGASPDPEIPSLDEADLCKAHLEGATPECDVRGMDHYEEDSVLIRFRPVT